MTADQRLAALERQLDEMQKELQSFLTRISSLEQKSIAVQAVQGEKKEQPMRTVGNGNSKNASLARDDKASKLEPILRMPISRLVLSKRAENCLHCANIMTVGQLVCLSEKDLLGLHSFGNICLVQVKQRLAELGLSLRDFRSATSEEADTTLDTHWYPLWGERLVLLERELAALQAGVVLLGEVRASRVLIEDKDSKARAMVFTDNDGTRLILADDNNKGGIFLSVSKDVRAVYLTDTQGKRIVKMTMNKDGPVLSMQNENGEFRAWVGAGNTGPGLALLDRDGKCIWAAP